MRRVRGKWSGGAVAAGMLAIICLALGGAAAAKPIEASRFYHGRIDTFHQAGRIALELSGKPGAYRVQATLRGVELYCENGTATPHYSLQEAPIRVSGRTRHNGTFRLQRYATSRHGQTYVEVTGVIWGRRIITGYYYELDSSYRNQPVDPDCSTPNPERWRVTDHGARG